MPTIETHARLQSYADTIHREFPLVLAIGREPNTDLPIIGLKNEIVDKRRHRIVDEAQVREHISCIFGYRSLLDRVRVVLVSGLDDDVFRSSVAEIRRWCIHLGKEYAEMPFFYPTNSARIRESLTSDLGVSLEGVMRNFLATIPAA